MRQPTKFPPNRAMRRRVVNDSTHFSGPFLAGEIFASSFSQTCTGDQTTLNFGRTYTIVISKFVLDFMHCFLSRLERLGSKNEARFYAFDSCNKKLDPLHRKAHVRYAYVVYFMTFLGRESVDG